MATSGRGAPRQQKPLKMGIAHRGLPVGAPPPTRRCLRVRHFVAVRPSSYGWGPSLADRNRCDFHDGMRRRHGQNCFRKRMSFW